MYRRSLERVFCDDKWSALLVDPGSVEQISGAMEQIFVDSSCASDCGTKSSDRRAGSNGRRLLGWSTICSRLLQLDLGEEFRFKPQYDIWSRRVPAIDKPNKAQYRPNEMCPRTPLLMKFAGKRYAWNANVAIGSARFCES